MGLARNPHPHREASALEADSPRPTGVLHKLRIPKWDLTLRVAVYRKHVSHRTRKNFQLDLFDPNDGHYEYSSVATNKRIGLRALWDFMAGRGGHEKTLGELKQHLAFETIPTHDWDANSTWQLISALTHNVFRQFQITTTAEHGRTVASEPIGGSSSRCVRSDTKSSTCLQSSRGPRDVPSCGSLRLKTPRRESYKSWTLCRRRRSLSFIANQG